MKFVLVILAVANFQQSLAVKPAFVGLMGSKEGEFRLTQRFQLRKLEAQEDSFAQGHTDEDEGGIEGPNRAKHHNEHGLVRGLGGGDDEDEDNKGGAAGGGEKLTEKQEHDLAVYEHAFLDDQEHYYRAPGGSCNTTEQINAEIARRNASGTLSRYWHHMIERRKCLYYTKTQCTLVPSKNNPKVLERRCVCKPGRTWESGSCLAYHGHPCIWQNDCVINAKCKFPDESQDEAEGANDMH